ncbi:arsenic transporter [Streptomyces lavendofoliae]|uniref:Arsenic transporter n=1 Tax=Streptomyces lavendofoliae TaxID=67314 RepID=A0A918HUF2_9ACTN|nr:arsenic transporter [Streptomyces lavendofoliae]
MLLGVTFLRRLHPLDWLAAALLCLGLLAVATGLLPAGPAADVLARVGPLLVFLATVIVLAELTGRAEVFDVVATWVARAGKGSYALLFGLCVLFASVTTITLNLDTTAVLLTPVMLALASRVGIAAVPLAMTTVWLANTASLLLPVSNLTNLLAADRVALSPSGMAAVMWPPQVAAIAATMVCLWVFYWRRGARGEDRYPPPEPPRPADPVLLRVCAVACGGFLLVLLADLVPLWAASAAAALVVVVVFARRRREELRWSLVPWRLLVLVPGMFLVVETAGALGMHELLASAIGTRDGPLGVLRTAAVGAGFSNALNNLPAYVAGEAVVPPGNHEQLLGLLIGVNVGPLVTPWASLATLLWFERCRWHGTRIALSRFMGTSLVLAATGTVAATVALVATA